MHDMARYTIEYYKKVDLSDHNKVIEEVTHDTHSDDVVIEVSDSEMALSIGARIESLPRLLNNTLESEYLDESDGESYEAVIKSARYLLSYITKNYSVEYGDIELGVLKLAGRVLNSTNKSY